jgi:hypothetical protein
MMWYWRVIVYIGLKTIVEKYAAVYSKVQQYAGTCLDAVRVKVKVKQSRYRPRVAQRVPGS